MITDGKARTNLMFRCTLRCHLISDVPSELYVELRKATKLPFAPMTGLVLPFEEHLGSPLIIRRVLSSVGNDFIVDVDDVRGHFEDVAGRLIHAGWRPHLAICFGDKEMAVKFAEDHGETLIRMGGKFYSVERGELWCLVAAGVKHRKVELPFERN